MFATLSGSLGMLIAAQFAAGAAWGAVMFGAFGAALAFEGQLSIGTLVAFQALDLLSMIGFVMMIGVIVNHSILLVAAVRHAESEGAVLDQAIRQLELQVAPGSYQVVAFPSGSETKSNRPAAAYTTGAGIGTGIGRMKIDAPGK